MPKDHFRFLHFTIRQDRCAMKVGTDGTLLGAWAQMPLATRHSPRILDIGTGTGLIALMMAQRFPSAQVTGIEIDSYAVDQARENAAVSPFADRIAIIGGDVRMMTTGDTALFDAIVCNPPYFSCSLKSPDSRRNLARHTTTLTFRQLMEAARLLLADDGVMSVVIPSTAKADMEAEAALAGLFKTRQCAVRTTPAKPPKLHLMAFGKHHTQQETTELVIGSKEYQELTKDFYLPKDNSK